MKITYEAPKGWRVKNRSIFGVSIFPFEGHTFWWSLDRKEWIEYDKLFDTESISTIAPVKSYRAFRRHIKRKCKDLPKQTKIVLCCRYSNANIIHIKK